MNAIKQIERKITAFISKYYKNELLRGIILFVAIGSAYLLLNLAIEYFLWLNPLGRTLMFWSFILVLAVVFVRLIGLPLLRLFRLSKGITLEDASKLIGGHFPEVSDKLVNMLQLYRTQTNSEFVLASINQKQKELEPIPFTQAVDYRKNLKYLKFALLPVLLFVILGLTSGESFFGGSYSRFVNYDKAYQPPAPFEFLVSAENLRAIEQQPFTINVTTSGEQRPEMVTITLEDQEYLMKGKGDGSFSFTIQQPTEDVDFFVEANGVRSRDFTLRVIPTPLITKFEMQLDYPGYTGLRDEVLQNTGSATVPEGTLVTWKLEALATENIKMVERDTIANFTRDTSKDFDFQHKKELGRQFAYGIVTSNADLKDFERLNYQIEVTPDRRPTIEVALRKDTVSGEQHYHQGSVSDDYGVSRLELVYEPIDGTSEATSEKIAIGQGTAEQFFSVFPGDITLEEGKSYRYYFQVFDNDSVNGAKRSRSETFEYRKRTADELQQEQITQQKESIEKIDRTLQRQKESKTEFRELRNTQLEKEKLNFTDQQQLKSFLEKQKQQDAMMQQFSKQMQENLERFQDTKNEEDPQNEALQERLKRNEERLKRQEKLLEELSKVQDKLLKEELTEKLDQLAKQSKNNTRNLEQLLELTKRYYVQQKISQTSKKLTELGKKQEKLAEESKDNTSKKQEELTKDFDQLQKELDELKKENEQLKDPMDLPDSKSEEEQIDNLQKEAEEVLREQEKQNPENPESGDRDGQEEKESSEQKSQESKKGAQQKQKSAGNKMQQLGEKMKSSMMQGGSQMEQLQEDVEMLRQVLDNLITFSFEEEDLMEGFRDIDNSSPLYSKKLIKQQVLKENFQHIDDSLFALSLRNVALGEEINEQLTNADYSMNQALERFANNDVNQGLSSQQYVITAANTLADMLSEILDNMQQQLSMSQGSSGGGPPMPNPGGSSDQGEQLQDIIMSQEQLAKQGRSGEQQGQGEKSGAAQNGQKEGGAQGEKGEGENQKSGQGQNQGADGNSPNGQQGGNGNQGGGNTNGQNGSDELSEEQLAKQYEIYQRQQQLRNQLEDILRQNGETEKQQNLLKELEDIEDNLLENGLTEKSRQRMLRVVHELMKMKEAAQEQGQKQERESQTNLENFRNSAESIQLKVKEYFSTKEILSRESLPLDGHYRKKAQAYFNETND